ncbi:hypothetical protein HOF92_15225 [bacterium]|nr:hypothetical protein [bacterium]
MIIIGFYNPLQSADFEGLQEVHSTESTVELTTFTPAQQVQSNARVEPQTSVSAWVRENPEEAVQTYIQRLVQLVDRARGEAKETREQRILLANYLLDTFGRPNQKFVEKVVLFGKERTESTTVTNDFQKDQDAWKAMDFKLIRGGQKVDVFRHIGAGSASAIMGTGYLVVPLADGYDLRQYIRGRLGKDQRKPWAHSLAEMRGNHVGHRVGRSLLKYLQSKKTREETIKEIEKLLLQRRKLWGTKYFDTSISNYLKVGHKSSQKR